MNASRSFGAIAAGALLASFATPVFAAGTAADTLVTNSVTLSYQVNGFDQTPVTTAVDFRVDRALRVVVAAADADAVPVVPGQTFAGNTVPALSFDVTNTSNATIDLLLGVVDRDATAVTGFATSPGGGAFDATGVALYLDDGATPGAFDPSDTPIASQGSHFLLSGVAADTPVRILVVGNVPAAVANGDWATYTLVAAAASGGALIAGDSNGRNAPGESGATSQADDPLVTQNVFADLSPTSPEDYVYLFGSDAAGSAQDALRNGQHADSSAFVVDAAEIFIGKVAEVLWDPINLNKYAAADSDATTGNDPKAVPGAVVMYAVGLANAAGSQSVSSVGVGDDLADAVSAGTTEAVNVPDTVDVTLDGSPVTLDVPDGADLSQVGYRLCSGSAGSTAFTGNPAQEVAVSVGTCAPGQTAVVVYFVTIPL